MSVRAKFRCIKVSRTVNGTEIELHPVISGSSANDAIFRFTPYGELRMSTINEAAAAQFRPGEEYYLTFEAVPKSDT